MKVLLTGLSHHTAPIEVRERLAFDGAASGLLLERLKEMPGVHEAVILSTCNRVEVTMATSGEADVEGAVIDLLCRDRGLDASWLRQYLYRFEDMEAIRHLFRVAASLDSMVVGEPQILGQLKSAYAEAKTHGMVDSYLDPVLSRAFSVAKRVRSETDVGRSAVSISYAAIELARQIFGNLAATKVMLIGAGKMSELAARHLHRAGCARILVTNRTLGRAEEMASLVGGEVIPFETFQERLPEIDIVVVSSGAPDVLIRKADMRRVLASRRNRPMFLIDIAVPRNVEAAVNELEHVFLYDIDDLGRAVDQNLATRRKEAEEAEEIIEDEIRRLTERMKAREFAPVILELQQYLDRLGKSELDRLRPRFGELTPRQEEALAIYTRSLLQKVAHGPITELRRAGAMTDSDRIVGLIRRIFRMDGGDG
jgi:glutamyl-tRNA reductase